MATVKKKKQVKVSDLKPSKDAKGGVSGQADSRGAGTLGRGGSQRDNTTGNRNTTGRSFN